MKKEENEELFNKRRQELINGHISKRDVTGDGIDKAIAKMIEQQIASSHIWVSSFFDANSPDELTWHKFQPHDSEWVTALGYTGNPTAIDDNSPINQVSTISKVDQYMISVINKYSRKHFQAENTGDRNNEPNIDDIIKREVGRLSNDKIPMKIIAKLTKLSISKVKYLIRLNRRDQAVVDPAQLNAVKPVRRQLREEHRVYIDHMMELSDGFIKLRDLREALLHKFTALKTLSLATLSRFLKHEMRLSHQKVYTRNKRVSREGKESVIKEFAGALFREVIENVEVFNVDESSFMLGEPPLRAWGSIGGHIVREQTTDNLHSYTLILAISNKGSIFGQFVDSRATAAIFGDFLLELNKKMGSKKYVILLDNAPTHKSKLVQAISQALPRNLIFPPPYSPQFCPIEIVFGLVKKTIQGFHIENRAELTRAIISTIRILRPEYFNRIFVHCYHKLAKNVRAII